MSFHENESKFSFPPDLDLLNITFMRDLFNATEFADLEATMRELAEGEVDLFMSRILTLESGHIPPGFLSDCWKLLKEHKAKFLTLRHGVTFSAADYLNEFGSHEGQIFERLGEADITMLKTVSIAFPLPDGTYRFALLSGLGDFRVSKQDKRDIATALGLENSSAREALLNPPNSIFYPWEMVQYRSGLLKPMIEGSYIKNLSAICVRVPQEKKENAYVAITASALDSLIVPEVIFREAFEKYANEYYSQAQRTTIGEFDTWLVV